MQTASIYKTINQSDIQFFESIVGQNFVLVQSEDKQDYTHDYTEDLSFMPDIVVKPSNELEVSAILKYCNEQHIIVTPRGAGTGLSGGALAVHGGVIVTMERFNKIINIDERNFQATVEPGVINEAFQQANTIHYKS